MNLKEGHISKAKHNNEFLKTIDLKKGMDWAFVIMFYEAMHYVDAYLATKDISRVDNHPHRLKLVYLFLKPVADEYAALFQAGWDARYNVYYKPALPKFYSYRDVKLSNIRTHILNLLQQTS